jgi:glycosyltransferase involved in cell wall biosynthesis
MFETDRLPAVWLAPLLERDEVWVPCRQNFEAFADSGLPESKLRVVGETLDFELFAPGVEPYPLGVGDDRFVFLTNFDFSARKGWEILLRAWSKAFTADDPVSLVLKTGSFYRKDGFVEARIADFISNHLATDMRRMAPVHLLTDMLPVREMPRLYAAADAYVLASRGEGWGRPFMEAQAMGLPTIASRWGGQREFMDEDTSWLVDGELVDVPDDAELFNNLYRGHRWFEPDADDLAAKLREVASDWSAARRRAAPARARLIERFGAEAIADTLREAAREAVTRFGGGERPACVIRGSFGSSASLAAVNDGLAAGLEAGGRVVHHRSPGAPVWLPPAPGISHSWPHDFTPVTGGPSVVIVPWEYGAPPADWVTQARAHADRVWVPSEYVRERFVAGGMPPGIVEVVPNGFDPARFSPDGPKVELPVRAACTFLFVGGTIWRKGVDRLTEAWAEAFGPDDDVALVIKDFGTTTWYRGQNASEQLRRFAERPDVAPVVYFDQDLPAREVASLYRSADVLVAPYRGEGFCMPALEAMACGLPVIHTGTGPTAEFVPEDAGWALAARELPVASTLRLPPLTGRATVQEVERESLVAALRDAANNAAGRQARSAAALTAASAYTWEKVARRAEESLAALARENLPPARLSRPEAVETPPGAALVLYAPDWSDRACWSATLDMWAREFASTDPVTLALHSGGQEPEELAAKILGHFEASGLPTEALPDLMLCLRSIALADLVAAADAVLVDERDRTRPELVRRAMRVVTAEPGNLAPLRADLLASRSRAQAA